jgi:DNA-binding transcriptional LysR family regulator
MDRFDMLRTFVAVADRASFVEAARHMRISPTAASRAVAALELSLGRPLLRRTTRSVRLTEEGAAYPHLLNTRCIWSDNAFSSGVQSSNG